MKILTKLVIFILILTSFCMADPLEMQIVNQVVCCENSGFEEQNVSTSDFDSFEDEFEDQQDIFDPLEPYNRFMTGFNDLAYVYVLNPISDGYKFVAPEDVRFCVNNFFDNLSTPVSAVNNLLQGKFINAGSELLRFVLNSTLGVGGLGDFADEVLGIKAHNEDLGQTLGYYGVGSGFPLVLPIVGPSNLRDALSLSVTTLADPWQFAIERRDLLWIKAYGRLNMYSFYADKYMLIKKDAIDLYPFLQNFYEDYRNKQIKQ